MATPAEIRVGHFFAGIGGWDLAFRLAGELLGCIPRTVLYLERETSAVRYLVEAIEAGYLDDAPIWSEVATFNGRPWRGVVDHVTASLPCQPYSPAGKRTGNDDRRAYGKDGKGPAFHTIRIFEEMRPAVAWFENSTAWVESGWFRRFGEELSRLGYIIEEPLILAAKDLGASHERERVWIMAHRQGVSWGTTGLQTNPNTESRRTREISQCGGEFVAHGAGKRRGETGETESPKGERAFRADAKLADTSGTGLPCSEREIVHRAGRQPERRATGELCGPFPPGPEDFDAWERILERNPALEPALRGVVDGISDRVGSIFVHGNAVVPVVAAAAIVHFIHRLRSREEKDTSG